MKYVQNTHIKDLMPRLFSSLVEITSAMNSPDRDTAMLEASGLAMERALSPLLVLLDELGPIGVVDLAERIGRDYSTVSRQVARLEELGLVTRQANLADRRIKEAKISSKGQAATNAIKLARLDVAQKMFADWSETDFRELVRLTGLVADKMAEEKGHKSSLDPRLK